MDKSDVLLGIIDDRCRKALKEANIPSKIVGTVVKVDSKNKKIDVKIAGYDTVFTLLNKSGEILSEGDNVFVESIKDNLTNGYISERFGEARWIESNGLPEGGSTGQVLAKKSNSSYDVEWVVPKGEKGDKGDKGDKGEKGDTGNTGTITVGTTTTGAAGTQASVTNVGTPTAAKLNFVIPKGDKGNEGAAATVSVGTTKTGAAGTQANVTNVGTSSAAKFNFTIPRGEKGDTGTIAVGTTTTGIAGSQASVTNVGSQNDAIFNFVIPKGEKGEPFKYSDFTAEQLENLHSGITNYYKEYKSTYTTTLDTTSIIPINITEYRNGIDMLFVYINGIQLIEGRDYTKGNDKITLTKGIDNGTLVHFIVLRSVAATTADYDKLKGDKGKDGLGVPTGGKTGQVLAKKSNNNNDTEWVDQTGQGGATGDTLPIGAVVEFPSDNIPDNWLLCNGQAVSRTDYAELFAAIGTTWGAGNGSTTFNLPTKEGLVTVGKKTSDSDFNTLGKTGGKKTHTHTQGQTGSTTLTIAQIPSHIHSSLYHKNADNPLGLNGGSNNGYTLGWSNGTFDANGDLITSSTGGGQGHTHTNPTTNSSSSIQPYTTSNFIIKAKQNAGVVATVVDNLNSTSATDALSAKQGKELNQKIDAKIVTNTEIATNEYVDGKRVYIKQIEFTDVLNAGQSITKPLNLPQASRIWIDTANSYFINLTGGRTVPIPCICYEGNFSDRVGIQISYGAVVLYADTGWNEAWTKVIRLKYIK